MKYQFIKRILLASSIILFSSFVSAEIELDNQVFKVVQKKDKDGKIIEKWQTAENMLPGDMVGYKILFTNKGDEAAKNIIINNHIPKHTAYKGESASGSNSQIKFSVDNKIFASANKLMIQKNGKKIKASNNDYQHVRWLINQPLAAGETSSVQYVVTIK